MHFDVPHFRKKPAIARQKAHIGENTESTFGAGENLTAKRICRDSESVANERSDARRQRRPAHMPNAPESNQLQCAIHCGRLGLPWACRPAHFARSAYNSYRGRFVETQDIFYDPKIGAVKEIAVRTVHLTGGLRFHDTQAFRRGFILIADAS